MSKTILGVLTAPLTLIDKDVGRAISGAVLTAIGVATGNPFLIAAGLNEFSSAFTKAQRPETSSASIKTERPSRVSGYGRYKTFGAQILYETDSNGSAVDVWAFHDGRIHAIEQYYLNDDLVTLDGDFLVNALDDGRYGKRSIQVKANLGAATETAWPEVIAKLPGLWTENHRGDGVVTGFMISNAVKASSYQEIYATGGPNQTPVALTIRAQPVFDWRDETQSLDAPLSWKWSENFILHLAHYQLVRNGKTWARHFAPTLDYWTAAADDADIAMPLKGVQTITTAGGGDGDGYIDVAAVTGLSAGMSILITASDNPTHSETKTVVSVTGHTIDFAGSLHHDHPVGSAVYWASDPANPATEPRYRSCVVHKHAGDAGQHKAVIGALLACGDGWMSPRQDGALIVYSGRYYPPTVSIGPSQVISYSVEDGIEDESAVNNLGVTYVSSAHKFNVVDTDSWIDEDDIIARGAQRPDQLDNQVPSHAQARRLAKRKIAQTMAPKRGQVITTSDGDAVVGQRYIHLRLAEAEGTADEFIAYDGPAEVTQLTRNIQTGAVSFAWIAADPNIDDWNPITEEGEPAPVGDRVAREPLEAPVVLSATAEFGSESGAGVQGVYIDLLVTSLDRDDLTWFARTRTAGSPVWGEREYSDIDADTTVQIITEFVAADTHVEVEVAYQVGDGRVSPYSALQVVDTSTAGVAPGQVTALAATGNTGSADITYRNPTSSNFAYARLYRGTTSSFGSATLIGGNRTGSLGGTQTITDTVTAGTYYWWVRSFNASGAGSTPTGPVTAIVT